MSGDIDIKLVVRDEPLVGLLLLCGLVALWLGRRRLGGGCVALALGLLLLFAWQPFAAVLI